MAEFIDAAPPPSAERIAWFEDYYEVRLPDDFKTFLGQRNGAKPSEDGLPDGRNERMVERFLPLLADPKADPEHGWADMTVVITQLDERLLEDEDAVGVPLIPIAALAGGDFVCLDYRGGGPRVVIWDHEESEEMAPVVTPVADSFSDLLGKLRP